ncbi:hypothetical protein T439DRAFT_357926 [Meredithblackwellia eburnea MCA 4105]
MIENRDLPILAPLIADTLRKIPPEWPMQIWGSPLNIPNLRSSPLLQSYLKSGKLNLTTNPHHAEIASSLGLTYFLTKPWFWQEALPHEAQDIFFFQSDSYVCRSSDSDSPDLNAFLGYREYPSLGYDWVGSPWFSRGPSPWGGNGGTSLRKKSALLHVTSERQWDRVDPEDVWFAREIDDMRRTRVIDETVKRGVNVDIEIYNDESLQFWGENALEFVQASGPPTAKRPQPWQPSSDSDSDSSSNGSLWEDHDPPYPSAEIYGITLKAPDSEPNNEALSANVVYRISPRALFPSSFQAHSSSPSFSINVRGSINVEGQILKFAPREAVLLTTKASMKVTGLSPGRLVATIQDKVHSHETDPVNQVVLTGVLSHSRRIISEMKASYLPFSFTPVLRKGFTQWKCSMPQLPNGITVDFRDTDGEYGYRIAVAPTNGRLRVIFNEGDIPARIKAVRVDGGDFPFKLLGCDGDIHAIDCKAGRSIETFTHQGNIRLHNFELTNHHDARDMKIKARTGRGNIAVNFAPSSGYPRSYNEIFETDWGTVTVTQPDGRRWHHFTKIGLLH